MQLTRNNKEGHTNATMWWIAQLNKQGTHATRRSYSPHLLKEEVQMFKIGW